jgi:hypothetical protein
MGRFIQARVSESVRKFESQLVEKYNLVPYTNNESPTVFFGLYRKEDYEDFNSHRGKSIIVWCGSDSLKIDKFIDFVPKIKTIKNIAMSSFISDDLNNFGIANEILPITPTNNIKNQKPRGENVYFYGSTENNFYGIDTLKRIQKKIPYKVYITQKDTFNKEDLQKIYESCFIGLRLTKHDGLPNTVCEMGLMGRRCIYNGNLPNAIPYYNDEDIITIINKEYQIKMEDNSQIVDGVYNYLNISDDWLYY